MRRLHLRWSSDPHDTGPAPASGDLVLVFARSGAPVQSDAEVVFADELLDWPARSAIEHRLDELLAATRAQMPDAALIEASEYDLRMAWLDLLLAHAAGAALREAGPFAALEPSAQTPEATVTGVAVGLGIAAPARPATAPALGDGRQAGVRGEIARQIVAARAATTRARSIRVLAFPGLKLGEALGELSRSRLRDLDLAVAGLSPLGYGEAAKLVLRRFLPAVDAPGRLTVEPSPPSPAPAQLTGTPALDGALADVAGAPLLRGARLVAEVASVLPTLERLPKLRAIVLPTAALGVTRLLGRSAAERGLRVASYQHGIYGLIEGDGGDRRSDVLFGWGPDVARQVSMWTPPQPRLEPVGVPGLAHHARRRGAPTLRRVLVATTAGPFGNALTAWGTREDFLDALSDGVARLRTANVEVELRLHPRESAQEYAIMDRRAGRDSLPLAPAGPFAQVVERADLLVTPYSSVAFEAAALAIPVLMWMPHVPPAVRAEHFVPPLSEELPGAFADAPAFGRLVAGALEDPVAGLEPAISLSRILSRYVAALDTDRFATALAELGT